jgi:hypothetical protein
MWDMHDGAWHTLDVLREVFSITVIKTDQQVEEYPMCGTHVCQIWILWNFTLADI